MGAFTGAAKAKLFARVCFGSAYNSFVRRADASFGCGLCCTADEGRIESGHAYNKVLRKGCGWRDEGCCGDCGDDNRFHFLGPLCAR